MTSPDPAPLVPPTTGSLSDADDRQWAGFAHFGGAAVVVAILLGFAGVGGVVQSLVALLGVLPSLVILLALGARGVVTRTEAKEALNFMLTMLAILLAWIIVSTIVVFVIASTMTKAYLDGLSDTLAPPVDPSPTIEVLRWSLGIPTVAIGAWIILFSILGGLTVRRGRSYRYPFAMHLVK